MCIIFRALMLCGLFLEIERSRIIQKCVRKIHSMFIAFDVNSFRQTRVLKIFLN